MSTTLPWHRCPQTDDADRRNRRYNLPGKHIFFSSVIRFSNGNFVERPLGSWLIANYNLLKLAKPNSFQVECIRLSTMQTTSDLGSQRHISSADCYRTIMNHTHIPLAWTLLLLVFKYITTCRPTTTARLSISVFVQSAYVYHVASEKAWCPTDVANRNLWGCDILLTILVVQREHLIMCVCVCVCVCVIFERNDLA